MSLYSIVLLLVLIIILILSFSTITRYKYLFITIVTLLLSILAFFFDPVAALNNGDYTDLFRFFRTLDAIKGLPFNNSVAIFREYNNIPVMKVLLFIISRVNINQLLPFVVCFIFYESTGIFIIKISERYNISSKLVGMFFFIFVCLFNYKMVICNIRCPMGDAIFILTVYYDIFKKNKNKLYPLGYLICWGIHPIFLLFTVLRLLLIIMNKITDKLFFSIVLLYTLGINYYFELINNFIDVEIFNYLFMKLDYYINYWNSNSNEPLIILTGIIQILTLLFFVLSLRKKIKKNSVEEKFYKLTIIYILFTIGSYWNFVVFQRATWLIIFFIIFWYIYSKGLSVKKGTYIVTMYDIVVTLLVIFSLVSYFLTYQYNVLTF